MLLMRSLSVRLRRKRGCFDESAPSDPTISITAKDKKGMNPSASGKDIDVSNTGRSMSSEITAPAATD